MLKPGQQAPEFALKDKDGVQHSLKNISSDFTIIYFYPKDDTPGCTIEAQLFSAHLSEFRRLNTTVIGISGGDEDSKRKFCEKHDLKVLLLSDPDFWVCKKYGVYGKKSFIGKSFMGILRTTFILNNKHMIIKVFENVLPKDHVRDVISFLQSQN